MVPMKILICLHDIAEDDNDGVELIEEEFGIDTLIEVLWMSVPKKRVRDGVTRLILGKPKYSEVLKQFTNIYQNVQVGKPIDKGYIDSLTFLLE
jgi:hypothetical protein